MFYDRSNNAVKKPKNREIKQRISVYGVCIKDKKILFVIPTWNDFLDLPGGGTKGKTHEQGLITEFIEETGYDLLEYDKTPFTVLKSNFYSDDLDIFYENTSYFYIVKKLGEQDKTKIQPDEIKELKWININELDKYELAKKHREALNILFEKFKNIENLELFN
ncbi:NUDIX domain-containing protein [archaeon]|jgi:8-oxo-dGTP pyrophosphatase MutT (NUDIX family)|nr:NUDIX domain-containing protein [archaeon]MBT4022178.1 NUDIX domain-containing protein [archaeon]MBT4272791.1 NUDIX domain-containing protein [archaeon]MBT4461590.1 NUDIX domain-containing protein [archaeon]MBT4857642.1 NUDIX domain-containing protein [archaeon]